MKPTFLGIKVEDYLKVSGLSTYVALVKFDYTRGSTDPLSDCHS